MSEATLAAATAIAARVHIPGWGVPWLDAELDDEVTLERGSRAEGTLADLTFSGTVISGGPFRGRSRYRLAAGAGGWGRVISARDYTNDAGVKIATVLVDAATDAGETLDASTIPTGTLGTRFTRESGPASRVLELLAPRGWYVGLDGVTRIGARARTEIETEITIQDGTDLDAGVVKVAADQIAAIVPGAVVSGLKAIDVMHELRDRKLRTTVWGASEAQASVRLSTLARLVRALLPDYKYRGGPYEYRVVSADGKRWNLQAVRKSLGLPDLRRVRVRPGLAGAAADLKLGSLVLVAFIDADPSRPVIVAAEDEDGPGFLPDEIRLGRALAPVVREGDTVTVGSASGPIEITVGLGLPPEKSRVLA